MKMKRIHATQTPTIRAAIKSGDEWFNKEIDLATQAELDAEFSDADDAPHPVSLTIYKTTDLLTTDVFRKENATACAGFSNVAVPVAALIAPDVVSSEELDYNFSHTLDTRAANPFQTSGVYWFVYTIYPKTGAPIVIAQGVEVG